MILVIARLVLSLEVSVPGRHVRDHALCNKKSQNGIVFGICRSMKPAGCDDKWGGAKTDKSAKTIDLLLKIFCYKS